MKEYHKIQTVYLRDPATNHKTLLEGRYAKPEFEYLCNTDWNWTEKVDGMNIRVMFDANQGAPWFGGKTDRAEIHPMLTTKLQERFTEGKMKLAFPDGSDVCLYGEGFGAGIQKGGGNYIADGKDFVLFDVKIGDMWLEHHNVLDIAKKLDIPIAPIFITSNIATAVEMTQKGFNSAWGNFLAEGLVGRPLVELTNRFRERIITKLKHKDFAK